MDMETKYCTILQRISQRDIRVRSAYLQRLSLGPELFAFLVKLRLEGAFNVLVSSLETL